jgi:hypothetical protein
MNKMWSILIIVLLASCTKDVTIDISNPESKIVVNSFFSPKGTLIVNISKSIPILAIDTVNIINNAEVQLFQDGSLLGQLTYNQNGVYSLPIALMPTEAYSINVSVPEMKTVTSDDTIPVQVPILRLDTISVNDKYLYCEISFQDIPQTTNYYLLDVTSKYPVMNSDSISSKYIEMVISDNIVENGSSGDMRQRLFFSDNKIQDTEYELSFLLEKKPLLKSIQDGSNNVYINFKTISAAFYKYLKTYYESQTKQMDVYSNIINGYGIFAGYNLSQDSIIIQQ